VDPLDRALIEALRRSPRASYRSLSQALGVGEPVVASRLQRLQGDSLLRVMPLLEMPALGFEHMVNFGVRIEDQLPDVVAKEIAAVPEVFGLTGTSGRFQLVGTLFARSKADLRRLLEETLGGIRGVQDIEPELVLESVATLPDMAATLRGVDRPIAWPAEGEGPARLDPLDRRIVDVLQQDGRQSYREVGRRLTKPEATIRSRVRRMLDRGLIRFAALTDVQVFGENVPAWLCLRVRGSKVPEVIDLLRPASGFLGVMLGRFNLQALPLTTRAAFEELLFQRLARLEGVEQIETWDIRRLYKQDMRVAPPSPAATRT
jgi:Lrp/AsnC family transcriptional regulator for asnA, asnC and gidA